MLNNLAEFLGAHAVAALVASSVLMLLGTAVVWRIIQRFGDALWQLVARLWHFVPMRSM
jgi:hypothetical protein